MQGIKLTFALDYIRLFYMGTFGLKTGGRKKGTPNKTTAHQRELLASFMSDEFSNFVKMYRSLEPEDKVKTYVQMLPYVAPKLQSVELDMSPEATTSVDLELRKLSEDFDK